MTAAIHLAAADYLKLGFRLVPLEPGQKLPRTPGWQNNPIADFSQLGEAFSGGRGIGLHHGASGTAMLDIDDPELARLALMAVSINLDDLLDASGPKVYTSRSLKPLYRQPYGSSLSRRSLAYKDADGKVHTVFELRSGLAQDVLPPTVHPSTGLAYTWQPGPPLSRGDIPELPGNLLTLWENWPELKPFLDEANPWAAPPEPPPLALRSEGNREGDSVIASFNRSHSIRELLEAHNYTAKGVDRFIAPNSKTRMPGVKLFTDGDLERVFSHHGSDALADDHSHDAFGVFTILEHDGDVKAAVKAAAADLGLSLSTTPKAPPPREVPFEDEKPPEKQSSPETFPTFPLEVFPEAVRQLIEEGAAALPVPPDSLGVTVLALTGAAIGTARELEVKPGWREGPRIYAANIAKPGEKKSPAQKVAAKPFHDRQRQAHLDYKEARKKYDLELAKFEQERLAWRSAKGESTMPTPPTEPTMAQVFTTDATLEALGELHERNPRGLALVLDELSTWVRSMGQYKGGKGSDRQKFLSFWSGASEIINRKKQEPIVLPNPFVNVIGNLPPDILGELSDEQGREDGFIHRILFCYPDPVPLRWTEASISAETQSAYSDVFDKLWQLEPESTDAGQVRPKVLRFSESGRSAFREWITAHYEEMNAPNFSPALRGPWAKLEGYTARFALILHCLSQVSGEPVTAHVDDASVYGAAALADYFKAHARRTYLHLNASTLEKQAASMLEYLKRQPGGRISLRDLVRSGAGKVRDAKGARAVLEQLQSQGLGEFVTLKYPSGQTGDGFELLQ